MAGWGATHDLQLDGLAVQLDGADFLRGQQRQWRRSVAARSRRAAQAGEGGEGGVRLTKSTPMVEM